ncbi:MAG TPA: hypothetical protein VKU91_06775, partial [Acidimicrobiales bacterium]|nr:hypothetical protein [Acidimicrobiales bacterium]
MLTLGAGLTAAIRWGPLYRGPLPDLRPGSVSVPVGVNFGAGLEKTMERWTSAQRLRTMRAVARLGARWVRIDVPYLGPRRPWGDAAVVTAALAAGLHVDALLDDWSADRRPPPGLFAAFAARVAGAYARRGVEVYEVLNEENLGSNWGGAASAPGYAALLGRVYRAVKAADPRATVLVGGLSPAPAGGGDVAPVAFLQELYAAGAGGSFDGVAVHPYTYPGLPSIVDPSNSFAQMVRLRRVMSSHGDGG